MEWIGRMNTLRSAVTETVNALLVFRNKLIARGRYTDAIDEVMIKVVK